MELPRPSVCRHRNCGIYMNIPHSFSTFIMFDDSWLYLQSLGPKSGGSTNHLLARKSHLEVSKKIGLPLNIIILEFFHGMFHYKSTNQQPMGVPPVTGPAPRIFSSRKLSVSLKSSVIVSGALGDAEWGNPAQQFNGWLGQRQWFEQVPKFWRVEEVCKKPWTNKMKQLE